ncbi:MAG: BrnT family toxin [Burkholderiaceae bacterium]
MEIDFDPVKSEVNCRVRGLPFTIVERFDFESALFNVDNRYDYGELRIFALGFIDGRLHALVFKEVVTGIRVISLRRANRREVKRYEQENRS